MGAQRPRAGFPPGPAPGAPPVPPRRGRVGAGSPARAGRDAPGSCPAVVRRSEEKSSFLSLQMLVRHCLGGNSVTFFFRYLKKEKKNKKKPRRYFEF